MTLVIATRGIDLSVGAVMAIAGAVAASLVVDGNFNASELRIESAGGAELRAVGDAPLLKVLPGAPPVRLVGLTLHGAVESGQRAAAEVLGSS